MILGHAPHVISHTGKKVPLLSRVGTLELFDQGTCQVGPKVGLSHQIPVLDVLHGGLWFDFVLGSDENTPLRRALRSVAPANHLSDHTCIVLAVHGQDVDSCIHRELEVKSMREALI